MLSPVGRVQEQMGALGGQRAPRLPSPVACNDQENRRPSSTSTGGLQVTQNGLTMGASLAQLQPALRPDMQITFCILRVGRRTGRQLAVVRLG